MPVSAIDTYVDELGAALRGPRRAKADLLTEARDGLIDAAEAYQTAGLDRARAERQAVADFGGLDEVVPGFQTELGFAQGRRTALLVLGVFGAQPFAWGYAFRWVTNTSAGVEDPRPGYAMVDNLVEWFGVGTILVAMLAVLAYRLGMRHPAVRARIARVTGVSALAVSATLVTLSGTLTVLGTKPTAQLALINLVWTVMFVVGPVLLIAASARRCLVFTSPDRAAAPR